MLNQKKNKKLQFHGDNLIDIQIQQLSDRTLIDDDKDLDGKNSYEELTIIYFYSVIFIEI